MIEFLIFVVLFVLLWPLSRDDAGQDRAARERYDRITGERDEWRRAVRRYWW